jgi:hypothetical protein
VRYASRQPKQAPHIHHRAGSIVGGDTPELISDDVAFHLVLSLIGDLEHSRNENRLNAYLAYIDAASGVPARLSAQDRRQLIAIGREHRQRQAKLVGARSVGGATIRATIAPEERQALAGSTQLLLTQGLSAEGYTTLSNFVRHSAKLRMKRLANGPKALPPPIRQQ